MMATKNGSVDGLVGSGNAVALNGKPASRPSAGPAPATDERLFRELAETIEDVFWISSPDKKQMLYVSPAYERIWGHSCQSLGRDPESWLRSVHPEDRERIRLALKKQLTGEIYDEEYRIIRPDMQIRWIRDKAFPVRNSAGKIERVAGIARDITEYRQVAEQLRQSQKMEAIGQLAGGVAHDFNNFLAAMLLQTNLSLEVEGTPGEVREGLQQIQAAAERAAELIRQLLLFSRKQVMQARTLDLNQSVATLTKMLQRIIGEDINLQQALNPAPLLIRADPGMLDQVLMNLAVNSRDAMPHGGQLLIETAERYLDNDFVRLIPGVKPGRYACLSVHDTGVGIPSEILPSIFEPFFTTKEAGKGTGLGLSTVFGIVKQHGGFINVESKLGLGTIFRIYLPACETKPEPPMCQKKSQSPGGTETILLAEDDPSVRSTVKVMLARHGYRVLEAVDGAQTLKLWEQHRETVALLLTDLVLPAGMSGLELARQLQRDKPQLKVIFTSGYSAEAAEQRVEFVSSECFLPKPFVSDQLLTIVRRCLDDKKCACNS